MGNTLMRSNVTFQSFFGGGFCGASVVGLGLGFGVSAAHSATVSATQTLTGFAAHPSTALLSAARVSGLSAGRVRRWEERSG